MVDTAGAAARAARGASSAGLAPTQRQRALAAVAGLKRDRTAAGAIGPGAAYDRAYRLLPPGAYGCRMTIHNPAGPVRRVPENARFRIEHRRPNRTTVLGVLTGARPHRRVLDPFLSRLALDGGTGFVVALDEATGDVVLRRRIPTPGMR
jgi:hypothetical protein